MTTISTPVATSVLGAPVREHSNVLQLRHAMRLPWLAGCAAAALLCATDADALELGEASVKSYLGDRLHISIPFKTSGNEKLAPGCVSLVPANTALGDLPAFTATQNIIVSGGQITLRGEQPVREPLLGINLRIACNTAPHIVRSYQIFVDPRPAIASPAPSASTDISRTLPLATRPRSTRPSPASATSRGLVGGTISQGSQYVVSRGDTLSGIAARVSDRPSGLWSTVEAIYALNPTAFLNGDINLLAEGATLRIPSLPGANVATVADAPQTTYPIETQIISTTPASADVVNEVFKEIAGVSGASAASSEQIEAAESSAANDLTYVAPANETASATTIAETPDAKPFDVRSPFVIRDPDPISVPANTAPTEISGDVARTTPGWISGLIAIGGAIVLTLILMLFRRRRQTPEVMPEFLDAPLPDAEIDAPTARLRKLEIDDPAVTTWADENDSGSFANIETAGDFSDSLTSVEADSASFALDASTNAEVLDMAFDTPEPAASVDLDIGKADPVRTNETGVTLTRNSTDDSDITMAELDLLTRDYEEELTATQQLNAELATAVANLRKSDNAQTNPPADDEVDTGETAFFEEAEIPDELRWDDRTRANAQLMTDEILDDATFTMSTEVDGQTVEMRSSREEPTVEMPAGDASDDIYSGTDLLDEDQAVGEDDPNQTAVLDEDVEWEAFTRAANSKSR